MIRTPECDCDRRGIATRARVSAMAFSPRAVIRDAFARGRAFICPYAQILSNRGGRLTKLSRAPTVYNVHGEEREREESGGGGGGDGRVGGVAVGGRGSGGSPVPARRRADRWRGKASARESIFLRYIPGRITVWTLLSTRLPVCARASARVVAYAGARVRARQRVFAQSPRRTYSYMYMLCIYIYVYTHLLTFRSLLR